MTDTTTSENQEAIQQIRDDMMDQMRAEFAEKLPEDAQEGFKSLPKQKQIDMMTEQFILQKYATALREALDKQERGELPETETDLPDLENVKPTEAETREAMDEIAAIMLNEWMEGKFLGPKNPPQNDTANKQDTTEEKTNHETSANEHETSNKIVLANDWYDAVLNVSDTSLSVSTDLHINVKELEKVLADNELTIAPETLKIA